MTPEFTLRDVLHLLAPPILAVKNARRRLEGADVLKIVVFGGVLSHSGADVGYVLFIPLVLIFSIALGMTDDLVELIRRLRAVVPTPHVVGGNSRLSGNVKRQKRTART